MSQNKKKKSKKREQRNQENQKPASREVVVYTTDEGELLSSHPMLADAEQLPPVTEESLIKCHRYLAAHLSFPFEAVYLGENEFSEETESKVCVVGLVDPDERLIDEGLFCKAIEHGETLELPLTEIEVTRESRDRDLIEGYTGWFFDGEDEEEEIEPTFLDRLQVNSFKFQTQPLPFWKLALSWIVPGTLFGLVLGAILGSMEIARISALVGAVLLGTFGGILGWGTGRLLGARKKLKYLAVFGAAVGVLIGGLMGALAGAMLVAFVGILCGGVAGCLVGALVKRKALGFIVGLVLGPFVLAVYLDRENALAWGRHGAWIGASAGVFVILAFTVGDLLGSRSKANRG